MNTKNYLKMTPEHRLEWNFRFGEFQKWKGPRVSLFELGFMMAMLSIFLLSFYISYMGYLKNDISNIDVYLVVFRIIHFFSWLIAISLSLETIYCISMWVVEYRWRKKRGYI